MKAIILDIPTTQIFSTQEFSALSEELKVYRLYDQEIKLDKKFKIIFPSPRSYNRGLLFIASVLEQEGVEVKYFNSDYDSNFWADCEKNIASADLILASCKTNNYPAILAYLAKAKKIQPGILTLIGGPHPTSLPFDCLKEKAIDYVVMGEGEVTIAEFCDYLNSKLKIDKINGLGYKRKNKIYLNPPRRLIENLDTLPLPAYHLLPGGLSSYHLYIDTSRGCVYNCGFCSGPDFWKRRMRTRSVDNFFSELKLIKSLVGKINFLHFSDPMLGVTPGQLDILTALEKDNLGFYFSCDVKANYIGSALIQKMKNAGVLVFSIGIETLNDVALGILNKNCISKVELKACKIIKGIKDVFIKSYWITGLPGETKKSLDVNISQMYNLLKTGLVDQICNHLLVPYPGTAFYEKPDNYGIKLNHKNWERYEGRSYPPVYSLERIGGKEIYNYFIKAHKAELIYYKEKYPQLSYRKGDELKKDDLSFAQYKGRLV
jgi:anaerobic magnesium-protoporphyrin IX monomethyl ester cyclase